MSTDLLIGLCGLAILAAMSFGFFCALLLGGSTGQASEVQTETLTASDLLAWIARRAVVDLVNYTDDRRRINDRLVGIVTTASNGRFTCSINAPGWSTATIRVTVLPVTEWRFKASVVCSNEHRTFYYIRTLELGLTGLDEQLEVSE